jgi:hypothetical protein
VVENVVDDTLVVDINVVGTVVDGKMYWTLVRNLWKLRLKIYKHFYVSYDLFKFKRINETVPLKHGKLSIILMVWFFSIRPFFGFVWV